MCSEPSRSFRSSLLSFHFLFLFRVFPLSATQHNDRKTSRGTVYGMRLLQIITISVIFAAVETALVGIVRHWLPVDAIATSTGIQCYPMAVRPCWTTSGIQCTPVEFSGCSINEQRCCLKYLYPAELNSTTSTVILLLSATGKIR